MLHLSNRGLCRAGPSFDKPNLSRRISEKIAPRRRASLIKRNNQVTLDIADAAIHAIDYTARLEPPTQIACYSLHPPSNVRLDNSSMRRFIAPAEGTDLARGSKAFFNRSPALLQGLHRPARVDHMIQACMTSFSARQSLSEADVIARQSTIRGIMQGYTDCYASYIDGKLYLQEADSDHKLKLTWEHYPAQYGFGRACTVLYDKTLLKAGPDGITAWNSVVTSTLGGLNLLLGGEIRCIKGHYSGQPDCFVELKCKRVGSSLSRDYKKWYLGMRLMGIPELFLGFRDRNNILQSTQVIPTEQLLTLGPEDAGVVARWNVEKSLHFGYRALSTIRDYCQNATDVMELQGGRGYFTEDRVWRVQIRGKTSPGSRIYIRELTKEEVSELTDDTRIGIVPSLSIKALKRSFY